MKLTLDSYLGQHAREAAPGELTGVIRANAKITVDLVNRLFSGMGWEAVLVSGWRPRAVNAATPGAAPLSKHMQGLAVDLADPEGEYKNYLLDHQSVLREVGLYMEHPLATKGWVHLQIVPPKSGKQVFYP